MALKDELPMTAEYVAEKRKEWGDAHVTAMVKAGMRGERNCFFTFEQIGPDQYRTIGTPFDWGITESALIGNCLMLGLKLAGFMRPPVGAKNAN